MVWLEWRIYLEPDNFGLNNPPYDTNGIMSAGNPFNLVHGDSRADRMLSATGLLNTRLADIRRSDPRAGKVGREPNLLDIEKTHVIFTNGHFKPFVSLGNQYTKSTSFGEANTGSTPKLGTQIKFAIPHVGDFLSDAAIHIRLKQPTLVVESKIKEEQPLMYWCDYPGERILKSCKMESGEVILDEYHDESYNFHRQFKLPPGKKIGWDRIMGQEVPHVLYGPAVNGHRTKSTICSGNQTPSGQKIGSIDLIIPLMFWFNQNITEAIPSLSLPPGTRWIHVDLATANELVGLKHHHPYTKENPGGHLKFPVDMVEKCELYMNNIFMNPGVYDIFIKRVGFKLCRMHKRAYFRFDEPIDQLPLCFSTTPAECLFAGAKFCNQQDNLQTWHEFGKVEMRAVGNSTAIIKTPIIKSISIQSSDINLYEDFPAAFYNSYLPSKENYLMSSPESPGAFFIPFGVRYGEKQPSGFISMAKNRNAQLSFRSTKGSNISKENPCFFYIDAVVFNFLLIDPYRSVMRYT